MNWLTQPTRILWSFAYGISSMIRKDDELAYAYYAANGREDEPYDRKRWARAYAARTFSYFRPLDVQRSVAMTFRAVGLAPRSQLAQWTTRGVNWLLQSRQKRFAQTGL